jgi:hypothetical protein
MFICCGTLLLMEKENGRLGIGYADSIKVGHVTKERI